MTALMPVIVVAVDSVDVEVGETALPAERLQ